MDRTLKTTGEAASAIGVSAQTLRLWEEEGLVRPRRTTGGQRRYSEEDLHRLRQVASMRRHQGWNVAAIRTSLNEPDSASSDDTLPQRLRRARRAAGLSQREVAERVDLPLAELRAIERGDQTPTTHIVSRLANAYLLPMSAFAARHAGEGRVVRANRGVLTHGNRGLTWEELCRPGHALEPALLVVPPGAGSGGFYTRGGTTFIYLLKGRLELTLRVGAPSNDYLLHAGDAMTLEPGLEFCWVNPGRTPTRAVWVEQLAPDAWRNASARRLVELAPDTEDGDPAVVTSPTRPR